MTIPARWTWYRLAAAVAVPSVCASSLAAQQPAAIPDAVLANIRARVDGAWTPSIVVGVVDSGGARYFAYGKTGVDGGVAVNQRTVYEIGSITKVFTGVLLGDMAVKGELALDDPVQQ